MNAMCALMSCSDQPGKGAAVDFMVFIMRRYFMVLVPFILRCFLALA